MMKKTQFDFMEKYIEDGIKWMCSKLNSHSDMGKQYAMKIMLCVIESKNGISIYHKNSFYYYKKISLLE